MDFNIFNMVKLVNPPMDGLDSELVHLYLVKQGYFQVKCNLPSHFHLLIS
jgi:hypothetical protein